MGQKYLIWGAKGWIGGMLKQLVEAQGDVAIVAQSRIDDYPSVGKELDEIKPDFVLNTAGIAGRPTTDYCEMNPQDTLMANTIGIVNLVDACWRRGLKITNYATGCIYSYDDEHPIGTKFNENNPPNFTESKYSLTKVLAEKLLEHYDNVLQLRMRLPVTLDGHPRCLVTKLSKYNRLVNIPNSITILPEMLPISLKMTQDGLTGIYNFTNPGVIEYNDLMAMYKKYINPEHIWTNFTVEEQDKVLKSKRCNCELDVSKLTALYPVKEVHESLEEQFILAMTRK